MVTGKLTRKTQENSLIYFLLDTSGSMAGSWNDTLGSLNGFIKDQREAGSTAQFVLATFDSPGNFKTVYNGSIQDTPTYDRTTLSCPGSSTALLDATMNALRNIEASDASHRQLITLTDGLENASVEFRNKASYVRERIESARKDGIDVVALAVSPDAWDNTNLYGAGNTIRTYSTGSSINTGINFLSARSTAYASSADVNCYATNTKFEKTLVDEDGNAKND